MSADARRLFVRATCEATLAGGTRTVVELYRFGGDASAGTALASGRRDPRVARDGDGPPLPPGIDDGSGAPPRES